MIALPPVPPVEVSAPSVQFDVQSIDLEIQAPDFEAQALRSVVTELFGVKLNENTRILTLNPSFPKSWHEKDAALTTADFDFSCTWSDSVCTWHFEGFGAWAESYDSIVVVAPEGTLMAGELADDEEGVSIVYYALDADGNQPAAVTEERKLSRKEKRALAKKEKERLKREKEKPR